MTVEDELNESFRRFQAHYSAAAYGEAFAEFDRSLVKYPAVAFRHFVRSGSAQLVQTLIRSEQIEQTTARLDAMIADHPTMNVLCDEPQLDAVVRLRDANIAKGLPSPFLVAIGKSASVSVARIFNSGFSLPSIMYSVVTSRVMENWARDYERGGASYTTHLAPRADSAGRLKRAGINKLIVHVRDPRQSILSFVHHLDLYPDHLVAVKRVAEKAAPDGDMAAKTQAVLGEYDKSVKWIEGWVGLSSEFEILFSTFEDFVTDRAAFVDRYLAFYGGPTEYFDRDAALTDHSGTDYHFRSGKVDEWREVLPAHLAKTLTDRLPEPLMERFNWRP